MKPFYKKLVLWILVLLDVAVIFSFSLQNAEESTVLSRGIADKIKTEEEYQNEFLEETKPDGTPKYKDYVAKHQARKEYGFLETVIRKSAHFISFTILGTLLNLLIGSYGKKGLIRLVMCICAAATVAGADETIQLFVPGRAGRFTDVLIDTGGALFAAILFVVGGLLYEKSKKRRLKMDSD